ncbi:hypothetical protein [Floridanema aerugineum]|uniref:Uncharacterized protein n=1 Tax=Floridaenema aerugineum BLCC-F46 TaxID=3153654 RepID=A0ABV4XGW6_9CYAN
MKERSQIDRPYSPSVAIDTETSMKKPSFVIFLVISLGSLSSSASMVYWYTDFCQVYGFTRRNIRDQAVRGWGSTGNEIVTSGNCAFVPT